MKRNNERRTVGPVFGVALLVVGLFAGNTPRETLAKPKDFDFTLIATLGDPAPGGGTHEGDFEPQGINDSGDVLYASDLSSGGEGVFYRLNNTSSSVQIARAGEPAPGGGTFGGFGIFSLGGYNNRGDAAFAFGLEPFEAPLGVGAGLFRYTRSSNRLSAVVVPEVTAVPGGGTFRGMHFHTVLNNNGDVSFAGIFDTNAGVCGTNCGLGIGVFTADKKGRLTRVALPGDPAPGGGLFDVARNPYINARGDVAFGAHVAGEECIGARPDDPLLCFESLYVRRASTGVITSIAHQGAPAPGGGTFRIAFGAVLNDAGDIAFIGDRSTPPSVMEDRGVFLYSSSHQQITPVARPGDSLPGGGTMKNGSFNIEGYDMNNPGDIVFGAILDTDDNNDGSDDTGLYLKRHSGPMLLVARTDTVVPNVGTITHVNQTFSVGFDVAPFARINNRGQVFFTAVLESGEGVMLIATPVDK